MSARDDWSEDMGPTGDMEPEPISAEMDALACATIDYSLDLLGETGELNPTLAVEDAEGCRVLLSFDDEEIEECLAEARRRLTAAAQAEQSIEGLKGVPVRYALAYDGAVEIPDSDVEGFEPALIVEYGEHGMTSAYSAYLLYQNPGDPQEFAWTDPAAAGEGDLLV